MIHPKRYLSQDFTIASDKQGQTAKSWRATVPYTHREDQELWFLKGQDFPEWEISSLIGSKVYKHFLADKAATDGLVANDITEFPVAYHASHSIKDFKTLS